MFSLLHQIEHCPIGDLPGKLGFPEGSVQAPPCGNFGSLVDAQAYVGGLPAAPGELVAVPGLLPEPNPANLEAAGEYRARAEALADKIKEQGEVDSATGEERWLQNFHAKVLERVHSAKSNTKGCDCGCSIHRDWIKDVACPVCKSETFLLTTTDQDWITRRSQKLDKLRSEMAECLAKAEEEAAKAVTGSTKFQLLWLVFERQADLAVAEA